MPRVGGGGARRKGPTDRGGERQRGRRRRRGAEKAVAHELVSESGCSTASGLQPVVSSGSGGGRRKRVDGEAGGSGVGDEKEKAGDDGLMRAEEMQTALERMGEEEGQGEGDKESGRDGVRKARSSAARLVPGLQGG